MHHALPASMRVLERGWLSSNNILLLDPGGNTLVDTGYVTHAPQTLALVQDALAGTPLALIINTHLHADHCGGNALLQQHYGAAIAVAEHEAQAAREWDNARLSFAATAQSCARFTPTRTLASGDTLALGGLQWELIGAPGHDPHAMMLFNPAHGILISADALWENGFGVIFPELDGHSGFAEQQAVLAEIARLKPRWVVPGHGAPFDTVGEALQRAASRLAYLRADPLRNARHALKVLIAFKLLEMRVLSLAQLQTMLREAAWLRNCVEILLGPAQAHEPTQQAALLERMLAELEKAGVLVRSAGHIHAS